MDATTIPVLLDIAELRYVRHDDMYFVPFNDGGYVAKVEVDDDGDIVFTAQGYFHDLDVDTVLAAANLAHRAIPAPATVVIPMGDIPTAVLYGPLLIPADYPTKVQLDLLRRAIRSGARHTAAVRELLADTEVPATAESVMDGD